VPHRYPDVLVPPDWTGFPAGSQLRLIPPGMAPEDATATIVVSHVVDRRPESPPAAALVVRAIASETGFTVTARSGPTPGETGAGITGIGVDVTGTSARGTERRLYVVLTHEQRDYGVTYLATEAAFPDHVAAFWIVVQGLQPIAA
jgi:hypothetical protein